MTDQILPTPQEIITEIVASDDRAANQVANQANAVTGIMGTSGSGKSSLADTAAEYAAEVFQGGVTLCYAADLGGFGNKRLSLIRSGIMRVWDPRNHHNPFETMELISLGAWPIELLDPERGYAAPDVPLILPRRVVYQQYCPSGHPTKRFDDVAVMTASATPCPTCGVVTTTLNALRVDKLIVRHRLFADVVHRIYDSLTSMNDWGLQDLQYQSAYGMLPKTGGGGSLLGAADALISGKLRFGSSSEGQYGFVQNRTYGWLSNIRSIPDQKLPATATFLVEASKEGKRGGGDIIYGPKIAGNARTAAVPSWLGNCLHASREPVSETDPRMVYRLWLRSHIDWRDEARIPYVAKHRGTPLGMPDYLEDAPGAEPWSGCSLAVFYRLLQQQLEALEQERRAKYPHARGMWRGDTLSADAEEVVGGVVAPMAVPSSGPSVTRPPVEQGGVPALTPLVAPPPATPAAQAVVTGSRRRRVAGSGSVLPPATTPNPPMVAGNPVAPPVAPVTDPAAPTAATAATPSPIAQQLQATLDQAAAAPVQHETAGGASAPSPPVQEPATAATTVPAPSSSAAPAGNAPPADSVPTATSGGGVGRAPAATSSSSAPVPAPTPTAPPIAPTTTSVTTSTRFRRAARPPVQ